MITKTQNNQTLHYKQIFDLTGDAQICDGLVQVFDQTIQISENGKLMRTLSLGALSDFAVKRQVGSAVLTARQGEKQVLLAGATMTYFAPLGELAKALNYHQKTGEFPTIVPPRRVCPKCKSPLEEGFECPYCAKKSHLLFRFFKLFTHHFPMLGAATAVTLTIEGLWMLLPYLQRLVIDRYITPKNQFWAGLCGILLVMLALQVAVTLCNRLSARWTNKVSNNIGKELRGMLFNKVQALSLTSISKKTPGELINRINSDTAKIQDFITDFGPELIIRAVTFVALSAAIFAANWKLALLVVAPFPLVFVLVSLLQDRIHRLYEIHWRKSTKAESALHDILSGIRVVKSFGAENREIETYRKASAEHAKSLERAEVYWSLRFPFINFLISVGTYLAIYAGATLVLQPDSGFTVGALMQFTSYASALYMPLYWFMWIRRSVSEVSVSAAKILEVLDEPDGEPNKNLTMPERFVGEVEFDHVGFGYKKYEPVLRDVSFHVNPGEMIGIVGHSGVGKSTLINLLLHLYEVTEGTILIDGTDTRDIPQAALRRQMGVVLQETFLFYGSVLENIRYSKPDATFEEVVAAARIANAHQFIINLPDGYQTRVGERGYGLSGGERQRIAIARAVLHNPSIIILDEATASLDTKTEKEIQDALERLTRGRTTFAIAHRLSTLRQADRLLVLDKGGVAEMGTHLELMQQKGVYYDLVMAQRQTAKLAPVTPTQPQQSTLAVPVSAAD